MNSENKEKVGNWVIKNGNEDLQYIDDNDIADLLNNYINTIRDIEYFMNTKLKSMVLCTFMNTLVIDDNRFHQYETIQSLGTVINEMNLLIRK